LVQIVDVPHCPLEIATRPVPVVVPRMAVTLIGDCQVSLLGRRVDNAPGARDLVTQEVPVAVLRIVRPPGPPPIAGIVPIVAVARRKRLSRITRIIDQPLSPEHRHPVLRSGNSNEARPKRTICRTVVEPTEPQGQSVSACVTREPRRQNDRPSAYTLNVLIGIP